MGYAEPQGRLRITRYVLEHLTTSRSSDAAAAAFSPAELTKIFFAATQRFVNEPVEEIRVAAGNIIKAVMEKQGHFQCVFVNFCSLCSMWDSKFAVKTAVLDRTGAVIYTKESQTARFGLEL